MRMGTGVGISLPENISFCSCGSGQTLLKPLEPLQGSWTWISPGARRQPERQSCLPTGREEGGSAGLNLVQQMSAQSQGRRSAEDREDAGTEGR